MAEFLSPGVFIEEVSTQAQVVEAVGTSTMAIVGFTKQGPVDDPRIVTSANDFGRRFGGFTDASNSLVPHSVSAFFANGGARAIVVRVVPTDAVTADGSISDSVTAESIGTGDGTSPQGPVAATLANLPVEPGSVTVSWAEAATPIALENPTMVPAEDGIVLVFTAGPTAFAPITDDAFVIDWTDGFGAKTISIDFAGGLSGNVDGTLATVNRTTGAVTMTFLATFAPLTDTIRYSYTPVDSTAESVTDTPTNDLTGTFAATVLGTGVTGTIDYTTGAISLDWNAAGTGHPANGVDIAAAYGHVLWGLDASSQGLWGNNLKLRLEGNENFFTFGTQATANAGEYSKYDVTILQTDDISGVDVVRESYEEMVVDDVDDPLYFATFINDNSDFVIITDNGDLDVPSSFKGVDVTAEVMDTGDTSTLNFTGTLAGAEVVKTSLEITYTTGGTPFTLVADVSGNVTGTGLDATKTNTVNYTTGAWELNFAGGSAPDAVDITADYISRPVTTSADYTFARGADGTLPLTRTVVSSPALETNKKGMYALNRIDEIFQLVIPDFGGDTTVAGDQLDFAEARNDVFVILSTPSGMEAQDAADYKRITFSRRSKQAAMYWPWVTIADPIVEGRSLTIPPLGHIAGIYARVDSTRNVGKAPGGTVDGAIRGITGLETNPGQGERDIVYPARINPLINSPQTGLAVWGVRSISPNNDIFRYVHATRLFQFVEKSIFNSTQGFLFENINASLYTSIKATVDGFLTNLFNTGHFAGNSPTQGFFSIVDSTNNPPEVFNAGQIVVDIGIAPNRPGEFIRFRFAVKTLDAA